MEFEAKFWLILLPAVLAAIILLYLANSRGRKALVRRFASEKLVQGLLESYSPARQKLKRILVLLGLACLLLALSRPILGYNWRETKSKGIDILFVLDCSRSMLARDMKPNRLERSKLAILDFVDRLEGDRVGLVAFSGEAFLQCPLTLDYNAFRQSLQAVDTNVISTSGTDIARAITESETAFKNDKNHKILVLITDGEDLEADGVERARQASSNGVTIYTVGVGTSEGEVIPIMGRFGKLEYLKDSDGNVVKTKLDEETLIEIAEATDGFYVPLGTTGYGLEQVYEAGLESIPEEELAAQMERVGVERFQWPLAVAIILLIWEPLIGTRRRFLRKNPSLAGVAVFLAAWIACASISELKAQSMSETPLVSEEAAKDVVVPTDSEETDVSAEPVVSDARALYNKGNRLYRDGDYLAAANAWQEALETTDLELQADAFYNLGNARYRQGAEKLKDKPNAQQLDQADQQALANSYQALSTGEALLEKANANKIPEALRSTESREEVIPQEQIQQAIQTAEQAKQASEEAKTADVDAKGDFSTAQELWQQALKDYISAEELSPDSTDASHNSDIVERKLKQISESLESRDDAIQQHERNVETLERLIEELKKLLEEQQNDQNQDQQNQEQNQDQQDQQQNQNSEGGDQQDQQQQNPQQGGDSQQQNGSDPQQQEQSQQNSDQQEQGESQENPQQGSDDQNQGNEGEDEQSAQQPEEGEQPGEQQQDHAGQEGLQEQSADEQSAENDSEGGTESPESMKLSEEDAKKAAEMAAAEAGENDGEENQGAAMGEGEQVQLGVMSREQARRFLDSMKDEEKKLPVSGYGPLKYRTDEEGKRKDW